MLATKENPPVPLNEPTVLPAKLMRARPLFDREIVQRAARDAFRKLNPRWLVQNPVIFVVEVGAALTTLSAIRDIVTHAAQIGFQIQISLWLWFTVLFANFAEAMAEARGKAQADTLRKTRTDSLAKRVLGNGKVEIIPASKLRAGDVVVAETGDLIPGDG